VNWLIKAGIAGASGYTGGELIRLLHGHPDVELTVLSSRTYSGKSVGEVFSSLRGLDYQFEELAPEEIVAETDVIFVAAPHGVAMGYAPLAKAAGKKMIDLGPDFRFKDISVYEQWYKIPHSCPHLLAEAVYGLPEVHRSAIAKASIIGNPGCYPTSIILALAPLLQAGVLDGSLIIADSKSGVSGAGRKADAGYNFCELTQEVRPYGVLQHRHVPEIEQELSLLAGASVKTLFTPHLVPVIRGIVSTVYARIKPGYSRESLGDLFAQYYRGEPFIRLLGAGSHPGTKAVAGSNYCDISLDFDPTASTAVVATAIDNLGKGAASQAVQCMNIMFGLDEAVGIAGFPLFP
jgi:N-acetyl-gamma-glutamyl-phosphate reductase